MHHPLFPTNIIPCTPQTTNQRHGKGVVVSCFVFSFLLSCLFSHCFSTFPHSTSSETKTHLHRKKTMQSFFKLSLLLAGFISASPLLPRYDKETCMEKGMKTKNWIVHNFDFHASYIFTSPSHQNSMGYVNFTLENPSLDRQHVCSSVSSQLSDFYYGTQVYECDTPVPGDVATYTFNRPTGELQVNQTWDCLSEGGYIQAQGDVTLKLKCSDSTWKNPHWQSGQIYSQRTINCTHVTVNAPITSLEAVL
ncbi:hypothetical protein BGZ63DRAFT_395927 [Mariannaea sp. PMI_226]|nr:hypothetical protein BGZ63DRAFT_395927 [Mariannaea sp. PMI_226]